MSWQEVTDKAFAELAELKKDWNSYGALPIAPAKIGAAKHVLSLVMNDGVPIPTVTPTNSGSVQLEWTGNGAYLGLTIVRRQDGSFYCTILLEDTVEVDSREQNWIAKFLARLSQ